jgi:NAD(P)-dependent dehydrogenase (short-subunit alcohol dehydrogenase family)
MGSLNGRVAFVIGASRGIGAATARAFVREGAAVALVSRDRAALDALAAEIGNAGGSAAAFTGDVTDEDSLRAAIDGGLKHFGAMDIAFNNSGVTSAAYRLHETPVEEFDRLVSVNLRGLFLSLKIELAAMLDRGGVIINNASISGVSVVPNISAYNATKHGVVGLTKSAAVEYARKGIRVNAVAPGAIMTNMLSTGIAGTQEGRDWIGANVPIGRIGEAEDVAEAVVWLASDSARYLTGVLLPVDGGYLISRGGSGKRDRDATAPREEARS